MITGSLYIKNDNAYEAEILCVGYAVDVDYDWVFHNLSQGSAALAVKMSVDFCKSIRASL